MWQLVLLADPGRKSVTVISDYFCSLITCFKKCVDFYKMILDLSKTVKWVGVSFEMDSDEDRSA